MFVVLPVHERPSTRTATHRTNVGPRPGIRVDHSQGRPMNSPQPISPYTILGLMVAAFGTTLIQVPFAFVAPPGQQTNALIIARELSIVLVAGTLMLIVIRGENLGLDSIGLHNRHWEKSLFSSVPILVLGFAAGLASLGLCNALGFKDPGVLKLLNGSISPWVMTLVMLRAGIVEEIFYRGYLMERLERLNGHWTVYVLLPCVLFGLLHFRLGPRGVTIAFVLSVVLALAYRKTRDLKANIIAHFLIDFISNVLPLLAK
jgi:uncharacterized protein